MWYHRIGITCNDAGEDGKRSEEIVCWQKIPDDMLDDILKNIPEDRVVKYSKKWSPAFSRVYHSWVIEWEKRRAFEELNLPDNTINVKGWVQKLEEAYKIK